MALGILNSSVSFECIAAINPTIAVNVGEIAKIPLHPATAICKLQIVDLVEEAVQIAKQDWNFSEISWEYLSLPWISHTNTKTSCDWKAWQELLSIRREKMSRIESQINEELIRAYEVADIAQSKVADEKITLARADCEKDCQRLTSYVIGCMMGRYSLDEPGLIYAHAGDVGFDPDRYATFPGDTDGIIPITDELWFEDDAPSRIREFLLAVWGPDTLEENVAWLAESLGAKATETPDEAIRRYIADKFFKDHLQTYKRHPIYWLFSSGKQGAFQALVYLHRYHEGTLARLRAEYVVPLTGKMQSRIEMLEKDRDAASSTVARNKIAKQIEKEASDLLAEIGQFTNGGPE